MVGSSESRIHRLTRLVVNEVRRQYRQGEISKLVSSIRVKSNRHFLNNSLPHFLLLGLFYFNGDATYYGSIHIPLQLQTNGPGSFVYDLYLISSFTYNVFCLIVVSFFDLNQTMQLFLGIIICIMSLHMYFAPPQTLVDLPVTNEAHPKTLKQVIVEEKTDSWFITKQWTIYQDGLIILRFSKWCSSSFTFLVNDYFWNNDLTITARLKFTFMVLLSICLWIVFNYFISSSDFR